LYGLLLPSGNDASVALAEHFGSRFAGVKQGEQDPADSYAAFIKAMNDKAKELGMKSTGFKNPHGLTAEGHQTTARDLAKLAYEAFKQPLFRKVVSTPQRGATLDSVSGYQRNIVWKSTNQLLQTEGYDGIKTGTTGAAGACLISSGQRDGRRLIVVALGATSGDSRYVDTRNLYRWAWNELVEGDKSKGSQQAKTTSEAGN
jgi:serine-type D-Ala-D-Ala carboxypeptidase (penicillin-binding protein 5/6)